MSTADPTDMIVMSGSHTAARIERVALRVRYGLTVTVAAVAITMSYGALVDLAEAGHIAPLFAWVWPVIVVGPELAGGLAVVIAQRTRHATRRARIKANWWSWFLLTTATGVSINANVLAAPDDGLSRLVHGVVPAVGFIMTKDLCRALRQYLDRHNPVAEQPASVPAVAPENPRVTTDTDEDIDGYKQDTGPTNPYAIGTAQHVVWDLWMSVGDWPVESAVITALGKAKLPNSSSQAKKIRGEVSDRPELPRRLAATGS